MINAIIGFKYDMVRDGDVAHPARARVAAARPPWVARGVGGRAVTVTARLRRRPRRARGAGVGRRGGDLQADGVSDLQGDDGGHFDGRQQWPAPECGPNVPDG